MGNKLGRKQAQRGVALVETALTMSLFLLIMFAVIEFALLMFTWTRGIEATRLSVRQAIVSDPLSDLCALDCSSTEEEDRTVTVKCSDVACGPIFDQAEAFLWGLKSNELSVTYRCSSIGFEDRPEELLIPEVAVEISGYEYEMIIPSLIGLPKLWPLPAMTTTRTGEDLHSVGTAFEECG